MFNRFLEIYKKELNKLKKIYNIIGKYYDEADIKNPYHRDRILFYKKFVKGKKILDYGCGEGRLAIELAKMGLEVTAVDLSSEFIKKAINYAKNENVKIKFIVGDISEIYLPKKKFETIYCCETLEHLISPYLTLIILREYLKDDGQLIISVPNSCNIKRIIYNLIGLENKYIYGKSGHFYSFDSAGIQKLLHFTGFKVIKIINYPPQIVYNNNIKGIIGKILFKLFPKIIGSIIIIAKKSFKNHWNYIYPEIKEELKNEF